jgi:protein transport protein SEC13
VSWAPFNAIGSILEGGVQVRRVVTGSCDNMVRIWSSVGPEGQWAEEPKQSSASAAHSDWVRDVAWAPNTAMSCNIIASCSEDRTVIIWKQSAAAASSTSADNSNKPWSSMFMKNFDAPVWRVSWSVTGNVLAVSTGDHKVSLWKQAADEAWVEISAFDSTNQQSQSNLMNQ